MIMIMIINENVIIINDNNNIWADWAKNKTKIKQSKTNSVILLLCDSFFYVQRCPLLVEGSPSAKALDTLIIIFLLLLLF